MLILTIPFMTVSMILAYLLLDPELSNFIFSKPLYGYSIALLFVSYLFVLGIVYKSTFLSPSVFVSLFFMAVPFLGTMNAKQYFDIAGPYFGRHIPSFELPTFLWSVGTASFFAGVLLCWFLPYKLDRHSIVLWDHNRIVLLLFISFVLATAGTLLAFIKIGHIPFLKFELSTDVRVNYFYSVGPLISRFSQHWPVPALLSSMLYFYDAGRKRYIYLCITIVCAMGTIFYAQRTGLVWVISAFGFMYLKFYRGSRLRLLAAAGVALILVYGLMLQAEYRSGIYAADSESRLVKHAFFEWSQYSIVVNEAQSESRFLGWKILVGPLFTFLPSQIFILLGQDKGALMKEYSAVFYYGNEFDEPYGIRITPVGEAFAAFGCWGVILQMLILGVLFGALDRAYFTLDKMDARLCLVCYGLSLMTHLPITTMYVLLVPLTVTGIFVFAYYFFGTRKYPVGPT